MFFLQSSTKKLQQSLEKSSAGVSRLQKMVSASRDNSDEETQKICANLKTLAHSVSDQLKLTLAIEALLNSKTRSLGGFLKSFIPGTTEFTYRRQMARSLSQAERNFTQFTLFAKDAFVIAPKETPNSAQRQGAENNSPQISKYMNPKRQA